MKGEKVFIFVLNQWGMSREGGEGGKELSDDKRGTYMHSLNISCVKRFPILSKYRESSLIQRDVTKSSCDALASIFLTSNPLLRIGRFVTRSAPASEIISDIMLMS